MKQLLLPFSPDEARRQRLRERILRWILVDSETGCWRWQGVKTSTKRMRTGGQYPLISIRVKGYRTPRAMIATRVSLEVFVGPPAPGQEAAHDPERCPYTDCVNPTHLRWASRTENEADKRHPSRLRLREVHPPVHRLFAEEEEVVFPF